MSLVSRLILLLEQLFHHFSSIEENKQPSDAQINLVAESLRLLLLMCVRFDDIVATLSPSSRLHLIFVMHKIEEYKHLPALHPLWEQSVQFSQYILSSNEE